jgi:hypothetical protein
MTAKCPRAVEIVEKASTRRLNAHLSSPHQTIPAEYKILHIADLVLFLVWPSSMLISCNWLVQGSRSHDVSSSSS